MKDTDPDILDEKAIAEIEAAYKRSLSSEPWESKTEAVDSFRNIAARNAIALCQTLRAAWAENADCNARIAELERRLQIPFGKFPCALCAGPHDFDTSVPSVVWNAVIRARNLPDYLCTTCIVREFVRAGESFTAELWNEEFNGISIEVIVNGQNAKDASAVQEENNSLRNRLAQVEQELATEKRLRSELKQIAQTGISEVSSVGAMLKENAITDFRTRAIQLCRDKAAEARGKVVGSLDRDYLTTRATTLEGLAAELEKLT